MSDPTTDSSLAVGWATVDLDRAASELAVSLVPGTRFMPAPDCLHLGARCLIGQALDPSATGAPVILLLEPSTEGRLAATLARHGEGWCATWQADVPDGVATAGVARASAVLPGPLGPERLLLGGPVHGPHRLLVRAATIGA